MAVNLLDTISQEALQSQLGSAVQIVGEGTGRCLLVAKGDLFNQMKILRDSMDFSLDYMGDVSSVDKKDDGFEVVYQLMSLSKGTKLTVKTLTARDEAEVPSITPLWPGADWMEREVYDLMGIKFSGHPNLARIFMEDDFEGHPLRKDFKHVPRQSL